MKIITVPPRKGATGGKRTPSGHPAVQATPAGHGDAPQKPARPVRARVLLDRADRSLPERVDRATNDAGARREIPAKTPAQGPAPEGPPRPSPRPAPGQAATAPAETEAPSRIERSPSGLLRAALFLLAVITVSCAAMFYLALSAT